VFPEGEEAVLGMSVVDEQTNVGWGSASHNLKSIDCGANCSGNFVGAKVEAAVYCDAVLEDKEGRCFVCRVGDGVYHDVGGI